MLSVIHEILWIAIQAQVHVLLLAVRPGRAGHCGGEGAAAADGQEDQGQDAGDQERRQVEGRGRGGREDGAIVHAE